MGGKWKAIEKVTQFKDLPIVSNIESIPITLWMVLLCVSDTDYCCWTIILQHISSYLSSVAVAVLAGGVPYRVLIAETMTTTHERMKRTLRVLLFFSSISSFASCRKAI